MTIAPQADSTLNAIRLKVRRLTNSPGANSLTDAEIDQHTNTFYNQDFAYAIKVDQMRSIYTIYTEPYIDIYPIDVNYNMGIRAPAYFDGIKGGFYKDREQFYNLYPRISTLFQPISGDGETSAFSFTIPAPFLKNEVVLGGVDTAGNAITVKDNGEGRLYYLIPNPQTSLPPQINVTATQLTQIPGMYNKNLDNPGLYQPFDVGSVDYVSGQFVIDFSPVTVIPAAGTQMQLRVSLYQTGRPYSILFWNNEFHVRPVPKFIHKIEVETYFTPVQFMANNSHPIIDQWWQYIAYGVACEIQRERNDFEGVNMLMEGMKRQEALVLERQGVEEIGQPNFTLFNSSVPSPSNSFWGWGGWGVW